MLAAMAHPVAAAGRPFAAAFWPFATIRQSRAERRI